MGGSSSKAKEAKEKEKEKEKGAKDKGAASQQQHRVTPVASPLPRIPSCVRSLLQLYHGCLQRKLSTPRRIPPSAPPSIPRALRRPVRC